ncbi:homocysteine S-methyltransferase family protein, partial [Balneolaceae bacterium ANBcel3]|nr:homocysteine S-methyltransferase family protein [Balneolaceae bacterium ANBcel3]
MHAIQQSLKKHILVLDGAMGTMIQKFNLEESDFRGDLFKNHPGELKGNNDLLSLTRPDIIHTIHTEFLQAGADIIETNTFNSTPISQLDYGLEKEVFNINYESARIARKAADAYSTQSSPRYVAGAIGPTNRTLSLSPDVNNPAFRAVSFDEMVDSYTVQIEALMKGGVDLLLVETVFDTLNCKAALYAILKWREAHQTNVPVMISGTIVDQSGRTLSGQTTEAFWISISHMTHLISVGLNCALGSAQMRPFIQELSSVATCPVTLYPNAGLPNEFGQYDESPEFMGEQLESYIKEGWVNMIGGCCGTTPEHIAHFKQIASRYSPRPVPEKKT